MDKSIIITQVTVLFLIMTIGFVTRKLKILTEDSTKGLTGLLLYVTAPLVAVSSFQFKFSQEMLSEAVLVFVFSGGVHLATILLGKLLFFRTSDATGKILRFATVFSNCGFMGYPVIGGFYGERGLFLTSIYLVVFNIFVWTYGVFIFTGKADRKSLQHALLNPGVIAVFLGLILFLLSIKLPLPIAQTMDAVGGMTTPLSMLIIGSMLANLKPADLFSGFNIYYVSLIRLLVIPLLTLGGLRLMGIKGVMLGVCMLTVAMPVATLAAPLAEQNGGDAVFASRVVFISTVLSMLTIPVLVSLI
jgi:predicted permease